MNDNDQVPKKNDCRFQEIYCWINSIKLKYIYMFIVMSLKTFMINYVLIYIYII